MKNLIIHPKDPTTSFLSPIYAPFSNKTVIDGDVTQSELRELIEVHDRVIMLGHGTSHGLLSVGQFPDAEFYVNGHPMAYALMNKKNNVFVWCDSDLFVLYNDLSGFCCGMFISEIEVAIFYGFKNIDWDLIDESNSGFASILSKYINEPLPVFYRKLMYEYGLLVRSNPVVRFNLDRLYLNHAGAGKYQGKVDVFV